MSVRKSVSALLCDRSQQVALGFNSRHFIAYGLIAMYTVMAGQTHRTVFATPVQNQSLNDDPSSSENADEVVNQRLLAALLQRPRKGAAFDRVYSFYKKRDSLEQLVENLERDFIDSHPVAVPVLKGLIYQKELQLQDSCNAFELACVQNPDDAFIYQYYADSLEQIGKNHECIVQLIIATDKQATRLEKLEIYLELAKRQFEMMQVEEAQSTIDEMIERYSNSVDVLEKVANLLSDAGEANKALAVYQDAINRLPSGEKQIALRLQAAKMYEQLEQWDAAIEAYQATIKKLRPGAWLYRNAMNQLERVFFRTGRVNELIEYYTTQVFRRPDDITLACRLAFLLRNSEQTVEAEDVLRQTLKRAPNSEQVQNELIELLVHLGRYGEAIEALEQCIEDDGSSVDQLLRLGELHRLDPEPNGNLSSKAAHEKRIDRAVQAWKRIPVAHPDSPVHLSMVAGKLRSVGRIDGAIEFYRKAIDVAPQSPEYREYLGQYFHSLGRRGDAIQTWKGIATEDRRTGSSLVRLAEVFATFDYNTESLAAWKQAADFDLLPSQQLKYCSALVDAGELGSIFSLLDKLESEEIEQTFKDQALKLRIRAISQSGNLTEAIADYQKKTKSVREWRILALLQSTNEEPQLAKESIAKAVELAPNDISILRDAADLFSIADDDKSSIQTLEKLTKIDPTRSSDYLRRLVSIQRGNNRLTKSLETAKRLVQSNPAAIENYFLLSDIQMQLSLVSESVETLRSVLLVAPNSVKAHLLLARQLSAIFATDEAIELLWNAIEIETANEERQAIAKQLVPLYQRRGDFDDLIDRITLIRNITPTEQSILLASLWEQASTPANAFKVLNAALQAHPRSPKLLQAMVDLLVARKSYKSAVTYFNQLLQVDNSTENQIKLLHLKRLAGQISDLDADLQELELTQSKERVSQIVLSALRKSPPHAIEVCKKVLERDTTQWDIKTCLAQLYFSQSVPPVNSVLKDVVPLIDDVESLGLDDLTSSTLFSAGGQSVEDELYRKSQSKWVDATTTHLRMLALQRNEFASRIKPPTPIKARANIVVSGRMVPTSSSTFQHNHALAPKDYFQAKWIARILRLAMEMEQKPKDQPVDIAGVVANHYPIKSNVDVASIRELAQIHITACVLAFEEPSVPEDIIWEITRRNPTGDQQHLIRLLQDRSLQRSQAKTVSALNSDKLDQLVNLCVKRHELNLKQTKSMDEVMADTVLRQLVISECRIAGRDEPFVHQAIANHESERFTQTRERLTLLVSELSMAIDQENSGPAIELLRRIVALARSERSTPELKSNPFLNWIKTIQRESEIDFVNAHRELVLDAVLAMATDLLQEHKNELTASKTIGPEETQIVVSWNSTPDSDRQRFTVVELTTPLSYRMLDPQLIGLIIRTAELDPTAKLQSSAKFPQSTIDHLSTPIADLSDDENLFRRYVSGFMLWWGDQETEALKTFESLSDEYPGNVEVQIAAARLAVICGHTETGFRKLDRVIQNNELDRALCEYTQVILAKLADDTTALELAAKQLLSSEFDSMTSRILANRIKSLSSSNRTVAQVSRSLLSSSRKASSKIQPQRSEVANQKASHIRQLLNLAREKLRLGDEMTAAEIAFQIVHRHPADQFHIDDTEYQEAVQLLIATGRTDMIVQSLEGLFSSKRDLASLLKLTTLLLTADRFDEAFDWWKGYAQDESWSPEVIERYATKHLDAKNFRQAATLYGVAFSLDSTGWNRNWYRYTESIRQGQMADSLHRLFKTINVDQLDQNTLLGLLSFHPVGNAESRQFADRAIIRLINLNTDFAVLYSAIPKAERDSIPAFEKVIAAIITDSDTFTHDSQLWKMSGWNDKGIMNGVLDELLEECGRNRELAEKFLDAAADAKKNGSENEKQLATLLVALNTFYQQPNEQKSIDTLSELFPITLHGDESSNDSLIEQYRVYPAGALWLSSQVVDRLAPDTVDANQLRVRMFEAAVAISPKMQSQSQSVALPLDQLFAAYERAGQTRQAAEGWLGRLNDTIETPVTGAAEDRRIRIVLRVAENLRRLERVVEAATICANTLANSLELELARRHSPSTNHELLLTVLLNDIRNLLDQTQAIGYSRRFSEAVRSDKQPHLFYRSACVSISHRDRAISLLEYVCDLANQSPAGQSVLKELYSGLDQLATKSDEHQAAILIVASFVNGNVVPERLAQVLADLPSVEYLSSSRRAFDEFRPLYYMAGAIRNSNIAAANSDLEKLLDHLATVAKARNKPELEREVLWQKRTKQSLNQLIVNISNSADEQDESAQLFQILDVALLAAESKHWDVVATAIEQTVGSGLPSFAKRVYKPMRVAVADVYGGTASVAIPQTVGNQVQKQLIQILAQCPDQSGQPLTSPLCDVATVNLSESHAEALANAVKKAVMPSTLILQYYPYRSVELTSLVAASTDPNDMPSPRSLSFALFNLAKITGRLDSLESQISNTVESHRSDAILELAIDAALISHDSKALEQTLNDYVQKLESTGYKAIELESSICVLLAVRQAPNVAPQLNELATNAIHSVLSVAKQTNRLQTIDSETLDAILKTCELGTLN
ncbi:hypothetical protein LOC67_25615 [Stieleria sp. JC731]|uniref:tetratricopeptide repeat protein n=1 Tax=Pirellulaceae TaxID=2691357 RepID=UPI001E5EA50B|nr:tetratricopeptide repeat protein [Stieleria sp. JC731]MCC9603944.1 hypothetical protein [Stieleria sp. JC731]